jgi:origin recognition complex subunit 4
LECLVATLKSGSADSTPIIIVLDEFDVFTQIPRQMLLYTLFDVAQSSQNPIAVIGSTCRLDTVEELLEKRVKSRFSHRQIHINTSPRLEDFQQMIKCKLLLTSVARDVGEMKEYMDEYNLRVEALFEEEGFSTLVKRIYQLSNDIRLMSRIAVCIFRGPADVLLFEAISMLTPTDPYPRPQHFMNAASNQLADGKLQLLKGLSILELCLLVAIKRIVDRSKEEFNFEMVYDDYKMLTSKIDMNQGGRDLCFTKPVALKVHRFDK